MFLECMDKEAHGPHVHLLNGRSERCLGRYSTNNKVDNEGAPAFGDDTMTMLEFYVAMQLRGSNWGDVADEQAVANAIERAEEAIWQIAMRRYIQRGHSEDLYRASESAKAHAGVF